MRQQFASAQVALLLLMLTTSPRAEVIFNNGPITKIGYGCDQGPTGCGASNGVGFTYADNFSLTGNYLVTGFSYFDFFFQGSPSNYQTTTWSIWSGNPGKQDAQLVYSGQTVATVAPNGAFPGSYEFRVDALDLLLNGGVYWLGIRNQVTDNAITTIAEVNRNPNVPGDAAVELDGRFWSTNPAEPDRAFVVYGALVPTPAAVWLFGSALGALGLLGVAKRRSPGALSQCK